MDLGSLAGDNRVRFAAVCVVLALAVMFLRDLNPATLDTNFGIEFTGGVRIPITLERAVDQSTMATMVEVIKARINKYGLKQSVVQSLGDREIVVEVPRADADAIQSIEALLREQGRFEAIIDGKQALSGDDMVAVGGAGSESTPRNSRSDKWELDFVVRREGGERFAQAALGKADFPVQLFLDRPENAAIILERNSLNFSLGLASSKAVSEALHKQDDDLLLVYAEDFTASKDILLNKTKLVVSKKLKETRPEVYYQIITMGFKPLTQIASEQDNSSAVSTRILVEKEDSEMSPEFSSAPGGGITRWSAIGLLSAPVLSAGLANGYVSQFYSISGTAVGTTDAEKEAYAVAELKHLKSVLSGGKLPVNTVIGSSYVVAPSLGERFLSYSWVALLVAIVCVSIVIVLRYRTIALAIPIMITNVSEILILIAIMGAIGTIDLGAMAGIITLIGKGVDDQLIITDEVLKRKKGSDPASSAEEKQDKREAKERIARAFYIIFTTAGVAVASMIPLILSGVVEVIGFALSTIIGLLIGIFVTRPAYGALIEAMFSKKQ
ncbi:TPA: hypothetical protein HA318_05075 [Candidatus Micrarchaeota archaeon]|nr:MAG: hypothetical protein AUJ65_00510 [Candidatus Micrarchaeota archaeon CG1_02_51_15]HII39345.1 hypothetical protein [Candidatus Micrarchaeota archaeon]